MNLFAEGAELNFEQYLGKNAGGESFLRDNLMGIVAEDDMKFVARQIDLFDQTLRINGSAGARDCDNNSHDPP